MTLTKRPMAPTAKRRRQRGRAFKPFLERLEDRTTPSDFSQFPTKLQLITGTMQNTLNSTLGSFQAIPVVGKGLQEFNDLANFVNQAADAFKNYTDTSKIP